LKRREEVSKQEALKNTTLPSESSMNFTFPMITSLPNANVLEDKSFAPTISQVTTQQNEELVETALIKNEPNNIVIEDQRGKEKVKEEIIKEQAVKKEKAKNNIKEEKKQQMYNSTIPKASAYYQNINSVFAPPLSLEKAATQPIIPVTNKTSLSLKDKLALSGIIKQEQSNTLQ
jgi:hypothetical protein